MSAAASQWGADPVPGVSACLICRDGAATIERAIESVRPFVDEVVVHLAGESIDSTPEILARLADEPGSPVRFEQGVWEDDFALARERSFTMASPDADWLLWIDADDELVGGENVAPILTRAEAAGAAAVLAAYDTHTRPDGTASWLWNYRIVRRDSGRWEGAVHEHWRGPDMHRDTVVAHPGALRMIHSRREQRPGNYLPLLERAVEDPAYTPRAWFLLGRELLHIDKPRAVAALETYLERGDDEIEGRGNPFRGVALHLLTQTYAELGSPKPELFNRTGAYLRATAAAARRGEVGDPDWYRQLEENAERWAAETVTDPLLPSAPRRASSAGRSGRCGCGSGRKAMNCCQAQGVLS